MADPPGQEALDDLLTHPGWRWFLAEVEREWGPAGVRYQQALDQALDLTDPAAAASQARQVRAARRMIEVLLKRPAEELARLKGTATGPPSPLSLASRRGGL